MLKVSKLSKSYKLPQGSLSVLRDVGLELARGESVALTGESGSGKSTLLHLVAGLDDPDDGDVTLDGTTVSNASERQRALIRRDRMGLVFQQFSLIPSLKVGDNLAFQARIADRFDSAWNNELADRLGLLGLLDRYPEQLSGGQQQRVAIGRALAIKPTLLLADEPTGNLDEATADEVVRLMHDLVTRTGCGLLMVTHSLRLAGLLDRRLHLTEGRLT